VRRGSGQGDFFQLALKPLITGGILTEDDFAGLAPALLLVARINPLCGHYIAYAAALTANIVPLREIR